MKVAVLGPVAKDFITIDGKKMTYIGGPVYYISVALKKLGVEEVAPYVSAGKDDRKWIEDNFPGMDVRLIAAPGTLESYVEYALNNPDVRTHWMVDYANIIEPTDNLLEELERFDWIIFGPLLHDQTPFALFQKLRHKNLVYGNFGMFSWSENGKFVWKHPENLVNVLPFLKYLFLDNNEALYVSGKNTPKEAADFFREKGLPNSIITEASKGSHVFAGADHYHIPSFPPKKIVDPTGAGDTYLAAFIRSIELFENPKKQGEFAAMTATMKLEKQGAFSGSLEDVLKRLKKVR